MSALAPQGTVSGSGDQRRGYPGLPRAEGFPKGRAFPSLTAARDGQPSPAGGRRSALARTDPPKRFFLLDRAIAQPLAALPPYAGQPFAASPRYGCRVPLAGRCGIPLAGTARSLFVKNKKRMGGGMTQPSSWLDSPSNGTHWAHPPVETAPASAGVENQSDLRNLLCSMPSVPPWRRPCWAWTSG